MAGRLALLLSWFANKPGQVHKRYETVVSGQILVLERMQTTRFRVTQMISGCSKGDLTKFKGG